MQVFTSIYIKFQYLLLVCLSVVSLTACENEEIDMREGFPNTPIAMRVAQWNLFMFGIRDGRFGVADEKAEATIVALREMIDKLNADVLFLNEYNGTIDQSGNYGTYKSLLSERYNYFVEGGFHMAIASRYPLSIEVVQLSNRRFLIGRMMFREGDIAIACIHPESGSDEEIVKNRIEDHKKIVNILSEHGKGIVAGDFNSITSDELDVYRSNDYQIGNYGEFGTFVTYPSTKRALDNIVVKGVLMKNYTVVNEQLMSDHYPSVAELDIL